MDSRIVNAYIRPESAFATISQWEMIAKDILLLQKRGIDTRGGALDENPRLASIINRWFKYQLYVETENYDLLTKRNVLDFIEDFANHRVWGLKREFSTYFYNDKTDDSFADKVKIAYFYSRGDIEPFVLLDDTFVDSLYGTTDHIVTAMHWTTQRGLQNIISSVDANKPYAISTFTRQWKQFFRPQSTTLVKLQGKLRGAFKSDVKSVPTDAGNRAVNMYRLAYPGRMSNMCLDVKDCTGGATSLWNEIIIKPTKVLGYKEIRKYE